MIKDQKMLVQFARYFGAALVGYIVDFSILYLSKELMGFHYLIAATLGFTAGLIVVFVLSNRYVFGESKIKSKTAEFGLFAIIGIVGLLILNLLMWFFTDFIHINYLLSKVIATIFVYIWNFLARRSLYHDQAS